jgi:UDP-glucose:(heptosyl)LPS alpha-1,3-glucosyltransferase
VKIALVILHADPAKGGAEGYTVNLAGSLKRRGHNVFLLATSFAESARIVGNVPLDHAGLTRTARYRSFVNSLEAHLDAGAKYDVIHAIAPVWRCDLYHPQAGLSAEAIASGHLRYTGLRRPLDKLATRLNPKRQFVAAVEGDLLTHSGSQTKVLCVSELVKQTARTHYGLPEDRLVTLFNAIDPARFNPAAKLGAGAAVRQQLDLGPDKVVALIVAQDFHRKGVRPAIEAIAKVADHRLVLVVVGKPDPREYRALAVTLGIADRVIFAGPTVDTYPHYQAADLFVLPTWHDPCSLVVLEALAMGLPTITTAQNGAHEAMTEGVHGYTLASPADVDGLAARLREMIPAERRAPMRDACLALRPRLSWEAHLDQLEGLYREGRR